MHEPHSPCFPTCVHRMSRTKNVGAGSDLMFSIVHAHAHVVVDVCYVWLVAGDGCVKEMRGACAYRLSGWAKSVCGVYTRHFDGCCPESRFGRSLGAVREE
jgi:hypothetical protein